MLKRIVKMTFRSENVPTFQQLFEERKALIRHFDGCQHLELWQDAHRPNVFFTYSFWDSETKLNAYRNSELFGDTWAKTKALFEEKPEAWSVVNAASI
jgi:heme oxygenase (mycobilin-producing)